MLCTLSVLELPVLEGHIAISHVLKTTQAWHTTVARMQCEPEPGERSAEASPDYTAFHPGYSADNHLGEH